MKPLNIENGSFSPTTQSTDGANLCYVDLHFNDTNSANKNQETVVQNVINYDNKKLFHIILITATIVMEKLMIFMELVLLKKAHKRFNFKSLMNC